MLSGNRNYAEVYNIAETRLEEIKKYLQKV